MRRGETAADVANAHVRKGARRQQPDVKAEEAVFLDDLGHNLKPADKMGIATIQVKDVIAALGELQTVVNMDLGVTPGTSGIRKGMEIDEGRLSQFFTNNKLLDKNGKNPNRF